MKSRQLTLVFVLVAGLVLVVILMLSVECINVRAEEAPHASQVSPAGISLIENTQTTTAREASVQQTFTPTWAAERVDAEKTFGYLTDRAIDLDSADHPHIAYGQDHLYYAWHDGSIWHYETVDPAWGVGWYASIALDSNDRPHISYHDDINNDLKYAYYDGSSWHVETVDSAGYVGLYTSIVLDGNNRPHISYWDHSGGYSNGILKYAHYNGSVWVIEDVDSAVGTAWDGQTSLDLDSLGHPHMIYSAQFPYNELRYAHRMGSGWVTETVASGCGQPYPSLALDGSDHAHIAYKSNVYFMYYDLTYAHWTGSGWVTETVYAGAYGAEPSIALDASDNPHLAYGRDLMYAHWSGSAWISETVGVGELGWYVSLALFSSVKAAALIGVKD